MPTSTWNSDTATSQLYYDDLNWSHGAPGGGADVVADFGGLGSYKAITVNQGVVLGAFNVITSGYSFLIGDSSVLFLGAGITGTPGAFPLLSTNSVGAINFFNAATAGSAQIHSPGDVGFSGTSSAGSARINLFDGGALDFENESTAAFATIEADNTASVLFEADSKAGSSSIVLDGTLTFEGRSSAQNATITQHNSAVVTFNGESTAGEATIAVTERLLFNGHSSAGSANIHNDHLVKFDDQATAGAAKISNDGLVQFKSLATAADVEISGHTTPLGGNVTFAEAASGGDAHITAEMVVFSSGSTAGNATIKAQTIAFETGGDGGNAALTILEQGYFSTIYDDKISVGSIKGAGGIALGPGELTVGGNNRSTRYSGAIDAVGFEGDDGSLVKVGTGRLILSGENELGTGATTVRGGVLQVDGRIGKAIVEAGTLAGNGGKLDGKLVAMAGSRVAPGADPALAGPGTGTLTTRGVELQAGAILAIELDKGTASKPSDKLKVTGGVNLDGAVLDAELAGSFEPSLKSRQVFTIIDNNKSDAIKGEFAGRDQGSAFEIGDHIFTIDYEGGSGNDVVLRSEGAVIAGNERDNTISTSAAPSGQHKASKFADRIASGKGDDTIKSGDGADTIKGGKGSDKIDGGGGRDTGDYRDRTDVAVSLDGAHEVAVKVGGKTEDKIKNIENLIGGKGDDRFTGDGNANRLDGRGGSDVLKGNGGKDVFVFSAKLGAGNVDTIADFKPGTDKIELDEGIFGAIGASLGRDEFYAARGAHAADDSDDRIIYNTKNGKLFYDADGRGGTAVAIHFATLSSKPGNLDTDDFAIV